MRDQDYEWVKQKAPALVTTAVCGVILVAFLGAAAATSVDRIEPGYIGVIVNNISGSIVTQSQPGVVYHLPFGITEVHTIDSRLQVFAMEERAQGRQRGKGRQAETSSSGSVKVKTMDGGDVHMDLTINYRITPTEGETIVKNLGTGEEYKRHLMKAYARSLIRDSLGVLSMVQISTPPIRSLKLSEVQDSLNTHLNPLGVAIDAVSATNFRFNKEYEELIRERKSVDQEDVNQETAQETARLTQVTEFSAAERKKEVALRKLDGQLNKHVIEAEGLGKKTMKEADGEAYRARKKGDELFAVASADAEALLAEGLKRAEGITAISDAYRQGGHMLVLESLAKKYVGKTLHGRPYNLETTIERFQIEQDARKSAIRPFVPAAVAGATKGGDR
jgi:regulator of protease activity HflC (stomatin/prohibitin superfamily)